MHRRPPSAGHWLALSVWIAFLLAGAVGPPAAADPRGTVPLQILDISDWHGQLDPTGNPAIGGAAALSTYFQQERAANPRTLTVTAGDAFGATPPLSSFFDERPAVLAQRVMGFDVDTFGNHNFDRGLTHLQSLIDLAGAPAGDQPGQPFTYVSANLRNLDGNLSGVAPYRIFDVGGVRVGVVGITNPEAPTLTRPGSFGPVVVTDPVPAANHARARAQAEGAKVVIAITHLGVDSIDPATGAASGALIDFANAVGGFDVIIGDHTDVQYQGIHNNALVVENRSRGVTYARIVLDIDAANGRVAGRRVDFVVPLAAAVTPDPAIVSLLAPFRAALALRFDAAIGVATDLFPRGGGVERSGEAAIGDLAADAIRLRYGTQLALTNGGGLRAPLPSSYLPTDHTLRRNSPGYAAGPPFDLVVGDAFAVLPFGNVVVTRTVTGAQLWAALENGVSQINATTCLGADGRFPQISGFRFSFQCSRPSGARVLSVSLTDGTPIPADAATYTFATNDFVNDGGDFYSVLADGQGVTREVMADVLLDYIRSVGTISPTLDGRITKLP